MYRAVVVGVESAGNAGAIARLVENFGIDELIFVDPQCRFGEAAEERASHATERLRSSRVVDRIQQAVADLDYLVGTTGIRGSADNVLRETTTPNQLTEDIPGDAAVGILFGREGTGLDNDELDRCDTVVSIPTVETYPVMNLSHAAAVIFHELFRADPDETTPSSREQRAVLENLFKGITERLGWDDVRQQRTLRAFRNVLGRAYVSDREAQLLLGAFRESRDTLRDT